VSVVKDKKKKIEEVEAAPVVQDEYNIEDKSESKDEGSSEDKSQPADIKLGEIQLREDSVLLIKKTNYKGNDRIDFRVWKNSPAYKGPTKQGFVVPMEKIDEFVNIVDGMKKKLK
jgi:hypothetical protein